MPQERFNHLLTPYEFAGRRTKNRIVFPAVVSNYGAANAVTERFINYYAERAKGGAGMVVTEALVVHPTSIAQPSVVTVFDDRNDEGLRALSGAVEREDCRLLGQLWHIGRQQLWNPVASPVGVSTEPDAFSWTVPHMMDDDEISDVRDGFIAAAARLQRCGFSGAELHGAHGYLIGQFLSPWSNTREDGWGGDLDRRTRFVREIIAGIRQHCGADFILGLKMPGDEGVKGGIDPDEASRITKRLSSDGGLDYIAYSQGNFSLSLEDHVPDMHYAPAPFLDIHRKMKRENNAVPVMAVGRIEDAAAAEAALADGAADFVALGRTLVTDAALPNKLAAGQPDAVRPCTFCNVCWGEIHAGKPLACIHNPWLGTADEAHEPIDERTGAAKSVVVVGAGVAGLQAAWVAAHRGHRVTVFGGSEGGGAARLEAELPGRSATAHVYEHQLYRAKQAGVQLELGRQVDSDAIRACAPNLVVLATGASQRTPELAQRAHGRDLRSYVRDGPSGTGRGTAVLFDQDHTAATYAAADRLASEFDRLVLVTPRAQLARSVSYVSAIGVLRRLYGARARIVMAHQLVSAPAGKAVLRNVFNGDEETIEDVDELLWSTPRLPQDGLADDLKAAGIDVVVVGDARSPRGMLAAIHEAHAVAEAL